MTHRAEIREYITDRIAVTPAGCWEWKLARNPRGYGLCFRRDWRGGAHRFTYTHLVGPIPDGLHLDHLCRNPPCVNPAHLEPVTPRENIMRQPGKDDPSRPYALYKRSQGDLWCAAMRLPGGKKKVICRKRRDEAEAAMDAWIATPDHH